MAKQTTITTYKQTVNLAKTYCVFKGVKLKDYVANLIQNDLKSFKDDLNRMKKLN